MARMHGGNLPAYAFYCRNVEGLTFNNVKIYAAYGEKRPALIFDKTSDLTLHSVIALNENATETMTYIRNSSDIYSSFCRADANSRALFLVEEENSENILLTNNYLSAGQKELVKIEALKEQTLYADFKTDYKYSVESDLTIDGLPAQDISEKPLSVEIALPEKGTPQICILVKADKPGAQKIKLEYNDIEQVFLIDWNVWGWAPISLMQPLHGEKVAFQIEAADKTASLFVAKIFLKNLTLGYTD